MSAYSTKAMDHFMNPRNVGAMSEASAVGEVGSLACGRMLRVSLRIDERGVIEHAMFQAFGCASTIAACSVMTELLVGRQVDDLSCFAQNLLIEALDGLPEQREFCADICIDALQAAIDDYRRRSGIASAFAVKAEETLDCRAFACPLNYVKVMLAFERMAVGEVIRVMLGKEGATNVPLSAKADGHGVVSVVASDDYWVVTLKKGTNR